MNTAYDKKKPSIVFHHGSGQINYLNLIKRTLGKRYWKEYNVFSIKAQHHENKKEYLAGCMNSFLNLQLTFVGSVLALEEIIRFHKQMSKKKITATGISMGGIVASLHFILFNTADFYIPIVAYPNAAEIYLGRAFENAVDKVEDRKKNKSYFMAFSFNNNISIKNKVKVFPILAKYDWYVNFDKAVKFWEGYDLKVYDLGHKSIAIKFLEIQKYMLEKTEEKN